MYTKIEVKSIDSNEWCEYIFENGWMPFNWRDYDVYGFLANVRNYSEVPFLSDCRWLPLDVSKSIEECFDDNGYLHGTHSITYLTLRELVEFDYDKTFQDMRHTEQESQGFFNGATRSKTRGVTITFRDFLGEDFFKDIEKLVERTKDLDSLRLIFGFDS